MAVVITWYRENTETSVVTDWTASYENTVLLLGILVLPTPVVFGINL